MRWPGSPTAWGRRRRPAGSASSGSRPPAPSSAAWRWWTPRASASALTLYLEIVAPDQSAERRHAFAAAAGAMPEVMEAGHLLGEADHLPRVAVPDMAALDDFHLRVTGAAPTRGIGSHAAMRRVASRAALPGDARSR